MSDYEISADPKRLDFEFIVPSLQSTYWAQGRARDVIVASFQSSLGVGAYLTATGEQVGLARVVTDGVTFSWLCDVFVAPAHRGHGLGKRLVAAVVEHPRVRTTRILLATKDAHGLYEQFGFVRREMMRRPSPTLDATPTTAGRNAPGTPQERP